MSTKNRQGVWYFIYRAYPKCALDKGKFKTVNRGASESGFCEEVPQPISGRRPEKHQVFPRFFVFKEEEISVKQLSYELVGEISVFFLTKLNIRDDVKVVGNWIDIFEKISSTNF